MEMDNLMVAADAASNEVMEQFMSLFQQVIDIPDDTLTDQTVDVLQGMIAGSFTERIKEEAIAAMLNGFREAGTSKHDAMNGMEQLRQELLQMIEDLHPSEAKHTILLAIVNNISDIFMQAADRYQAWDIILPMTVAEGTQAPEYAHPTDAAADLYANETITIPAHSQGTMVSTGVSIGLPDGWAAYIVPRSSTGYKTPLRQSNCFGVIDSHYRGELKLLFDNISDSDYTIHAGDRLSQMFIMPVYHFKTNVVDTLDETDRNEGGFGSTGK